ncbi:toxin-antitoxin system HicB family antitoxin [Rhizobium sp. IMFF44]|uniref:toxin-antitoxin system HicB family antitoxin n=1 Tax=unclassified Rhizobium TaxID=2613769 RepID=UPI0035B8C54C
MSTLTIRLPNDQHERLKALAASRGTSLNKLFEELTTKALTEFDAETRFRLRAAKGDRTRGLDILEKLDRAHSRRT